MRLAGRNHQAACLFDRNHVNSHSYSSLSLGKNSVKMQYEVKIVSQYKNTYIS